MWLTFLFAYTQNRRRYYQSMWHTGERDCRTVRRFGNRGDGGKFVCLDHLSKEQPINTLSIGSNGDFSFEAAAHHHFPNMNITVMDGTVRKSAVKSAPNYLTFLHKNFHSDQPFLLQFEILKMDCEGCELVELLPFLKNRCVNQLLLETHACRDKLDKYHALMVQLNQSYGVVVKEPNIQFSDGSCVEFLLMRRDLCDF